MRVWQLQDQLPLNVVAAVIMVLEALLKFRQSFQRSSACAKLDSPCKCRSVLSWLDAVLVAWTCVYLVLRTYL